MKKKVIVSLVGGHIDVVKIPKGVKLEVRDYDLAKDIALVKNNLEFPRGETAMEHRLDSFTHPFESPTTSEIRSDNAGLEYVRTILTKKDFISK